MYNRRRRRKDNLGARDSRYNKCRRRMDSLGTRDSLKTGVRGGRTI